MTARVRALVAGGLLGTLVGAASAFFPGADWMATAPAALAQMPPKNPGTPPAGGGRPAAGGHVHVPIPAAYAKAHIPDRVWTDARTLARGKEIYEAKCAVCHGVKGDGRGPGSLNFPLKPSDLTDAKMVAEMAGNYWFWRVSEGGQAEPFKSMGSTMPAWKKDLSASARWAVIVYAHTLSGHKGPHTPAEHPEMEGGHGSHGSHSHSGNR